ncbi:MAG: hypothetical protein JWP88_1224 [Flaviaesturariibacter sp.]|nr:hypothetical protein [Flaviaesturariibacter sp.]
MTKMLTALLAIVLLAGCHSSDTANQKAAGDNSDLSALLDKYYKQRMSLFPVEATWNGDTAYNDKLYPEFTDSYRQKLKSFYDETLSSLDKIDREGLNDNDKISYDFLKEYNSLLRKELDYHFNLVPTDQMWGLHLTLGQFASGTSAQPFKTVGDYNAWLRRIDAMDVWIDSAIVYFRKGMAEGITLPKPLVQKLIPQFQSMVTSDPKTNLYYGPIAHLPASFSDSEKQQLTTAYIAAITQKVVPMNQRMATFLQHEYLPEARTSSGYGSLPNGQEYYKLKVRLNTTTEKTTDEIYNTGLSEVARIRTEMERIKNSVGFKGDLSAFFEHLKTDPQFTPYKTPEEVLSAFRQILQRIEPHLKEQFGTAPKTPFEIRQTEAFRQESASAEYNPSPDNKKPGVFYVPIIEATKFNSTSGMESLFLHEAIPGHHYQISLQRENKSLPAIRQHDVFSNAFIEGWALYCESLGKDLGLYTDPYQHMGALGDEMHRAIRLVVDVAIHAKGMSREEAIKYMMANEPISEQGATAEIERYMSGPGQALGYKIGAIKIRELRNKYEKQLGSAFKVSAFHDALLKDGSMPLTILESKMDRWAASVK